MIQTPRSRLPGVGLAVLFKLETTQAELVAQPGPRKKTSALEMLKSGSFNREVECLAHRLVD